MKNKNSGDRSESPTRPTSAKGKSPGGTLDEELNYRLEATLSDESKLELLDPLALAEEQEPEGEEPLDRPRDASEAREHESAGTGDEPSGRSPAYRQEEEAPAGDEPPDAGEDEREGRRDRESSEGPSGDRNAGPAEAAGKEVIARIEFGDGDALVFGAIPADGEIGVAYEGEDIRRSLMIFAPLATPLRLFASLAPPETPIPWLLPAIDRPPDRDGLVGTRPLCERLEEPKRAARSVLRLHLPGEPDHWWGPTDMAVRGYCGWDGFREFRAAFCAPEWDSGSSLLPNIFKCTPQLSLHIEHTSTNDFGHWRRRRRSDALCAACASPVRVVIQYRGLGGWKTASNKVLGPANLTGAAWQGLIRRRRRIHYTRWGNVGGVRAFSRFTQKYVKAP